MKQKISDTLYVADSENEITNVRQYIRFVFNAKDKTAYYVIATTSLDNWDTNSAELLTLVNSLKVYK